MEKFRVVYKIQNAKGETTGETVLELAFPQAPELVGNITPIELEKQLANHFDEKVSFIKNALRERLGVADSDIVLLESFTNV